jgi:Ca-activated chloride channel family protein
MAALLDYERPVTQRRPAISLAKTVLMSGLLLSYGPAPAAAPQATATFKSGLDLVQVSAVVRDRKGRLVGDLSAHDFTILDNGDSRPIANFRHDLAGVSVALLFDVSGSMEAQLVNAREAATNVLGCLDARDEAAVFTFDTRLDEVAPFTTGLQALPVELAAVKPFGATSLNDAIAATAQRTAARDGRRRAVLVFTDGDDNSSRLNPSDVSGIASAIDVPVYIVGIVPAIDNPSADVSTVSAGRSALVGPLSELAAWTGGHAFVVSSPADRSIVARHIIEELRHQYLIAFESSGRPGWHPLVVRTRDKDLVVRARSGYFAGQSRPIS